MTNRGLDHQVRDESVPGRRSDNSASAGRGGVPVVMNDAFRGSALDETGAGDGAHWPRAWDMPLRFGKVSNVDSVPR